MIATASPTVISAGRTYPVRNSPMGARLLPALPGYRIGAVEIGDGIGEGRRIELAGGAERAPCRRRRLVDGGKDRARGKQALAQLRQRVIGQLLAECVRQGAQDLPVLARIAGGEDREPAEL